MALAAIRFRRTTPGPSEPESPTSHLEITACELDDSSPAAFRAGFGKERPLVFVIATRAKDKEGPLKDLGVSLGTLDKVDRATPSTLLARKGRRPALLAELRKQGIPWVARVATSYVSGGHLARGMGKFLGRLPALIHDENLPAGWLDGVYVLTLGARVFSTLHAAAADGKPLGGTARRPSGNGNVPRAIVRALPGSSTAVERTRQRAARAARTDVPVLLRGEPGSGKGFLAEGIHQAGRAGRPVVTFDCELFAGTDEADRRLFGDGGGTAGSWDMAANGTLFLAHVEALPLRTQKRLRNALADGTSRARVIAGSAVNLRALASDRRFDDALLYRLAGFPIDLPPLRERPEDIAEVAQVLWTRLCGRNMISLGPDLIDRLTQGSWLDNLRELRACLSRLRNLVGEHPTAADFDTLASEEGRAAGA